MVLTCLVCLLLQSWAAWRIWRVLLMWQMTWKMKLEEAKYLCSWPTRKIELAWVNSNGLCCWISTTAHRTFEGLSFSGYQPWLWPGFRWALCSRLPHVCMVGMSECVEREWEETTAMILMRYLWVYLNRCCSEYALTMMRIAKVDGHSLPAAKWTPRCSVESHLGGKGRISFARMSTLQGTAGHQEGLHNAQTVLVGGRHWTRSLAGRMLPLRLMA